MAKILTMDNDGAVVILVRRKAVEDLLRCVRLSQVINDSETALALIREAADVVEAEIR